MFYKCNEDFAERNTRDIYLIYRHDSISIHNSGVTY